MSTICLVDQFSFFYPHFKSPLKFLNILIFFALCFNATVFDNNIGAFFSLFSLQTKKYIENSVAHLISAKVSWAVTNDTSSVGCFLEQVAEFRDFVEDVSVVDGLFVLERKSVIFLLKWRWFCPLAWLLKTLIPMLDNSKVVLNLIHLAFVLVLADTCQ